MATADGGGECWTIARRRLGGGTTEDLVKPERRSRAERFVGRKGTNLCHVVPVNDDVAVAVDGDIAVAVAVDVDVAVAVNGDVAVAVAVDGDVAVAVAIDDDVAIAVDDVAVAVDDAVAVAVESRSCFLPLLQTVGWALGVEEVDTG